MAGNKVPGTNHYNGPHESYGVPSQWPCKYCDGIANPTVSPYITEEDRSRICLKVNGDEVVVCEECQSSISDAALELYEAGEALLPLLEHIKKFLTREDSYVLIENMKAAITKARGEA